MNRYKPKLNASTGCNVIPLHTMKLIIFAKRSIRVLQGFEPRTLCQRSHPRCFCMMQILIDTDPHLLCGWWQRAVLALPVERTVGWNNVSSRFLVCETQHTAVFHHFTSWTISNPVYCLDGAPAGKVACSSADNHADPCPCCCAEAA